GPRSLAVTGLGGLHAFILSVVVLGFVAPAMGEHGECLDGWWHLSPWHARLLTAPCAAALGQTHAGLCGHRNGCTSCTAPITATRSPYSGCRSGISPPDAASAPTSRPPSPRTTTAPHCVEPRPCGLDPSSSPPGTGASSPTSSGAAYCPTTPSSASPATPPGRYPCPTTTSPKTPGRHGSNARPDSRRISTNTAR